MTTGLQPRKPPRKIGRPCKLTPEVQEKICAAIADMVPYKFAALGAGVSYEAFQDWCLRSEDPEEDPCFKQFRLAIEKAEAEAIQKRLQAIASAGNLPQNWMAHAWTLERRYPEHFGRREEPKTDSSTVFAELLNRLLAVRQAALAQEQPPVKELLPGVKMSSDNEEPKLR